MFTHLSRLSVLAMFLVASSAFAEKTLWLVRPLYPGQEALVERTEKALDKLIPKDGRATEVIGLKELSGSLKTAKVDELPCLSGDTRCADPIDPFVAQLGFDRVVLIQGGQDEAGYKFRVVSYRPATKEVTPATASNAILEKALLGAVAKVVPVASSLKVVSDPVGAIVYVDEVKVGVTPLDTQVLPGERVIRLDLKLHQPIEETLIIPVRGSASLEKKLEKVAARIQISASPAGTQVTIDGQPIGKDKIDRGIQPGRHVVRLTADNHKAFEQEINVKAEETYVLDKTLEPIPGLAPTLVGTPNGPTKPWTAPPPPAPLTDTEANYERKSYFQIGFDYQNMFGNALVGRRFGTSGIGRTARFEPDSKSRTLIGVSAEYGIFGRLFGLTVFGLAYHTNIDQFKLHVSVDPGRTETVESIETPPDSGLHQDGVATLDDVKVNLVTIRAIQPQIRFAVWRFMFNIQAGVEFRVGHITQKNPTDIQYKDGFLNLDLFGGGRLNARFYIAEGFYAFGSFNALFFLYGQTTKDNAHSYGGLGFTSGVGYGF